MATVTINLESLLANEPEAPLTFSGAEDSIVIQPSAANPANSGVPAAKFAGRRLQFKCSAGGWSYGGKTAGNIAADKFYDPGAGEIFDLELVQLPVTIYVQGTAGQKLRYMIAK